MIVNVLERQMALDALDAEIRAMGARWAAEAEEMMERLGEDEETYLRERRERLAMLHHEDEATDEELLERWAGAKRMIRRSVARKEKEARRRAALAQRVAAGAGLVLLALGWIGLLALLWG